MSLSLQNSSSQMEIEEELFPSPSVSTLDEQFKNLAVNNIAEAVSLQSPSFASSRYGQDLGVSEENSYSTRPHSNPRKAVEREFKRERNAFERTQGNTQTAKMLLKDMLLFDQSSSSKEVAMYSRQQSRQRDYDELFKGDSTHSLIHSAAEQNDELTCKDFNPDKDSKVKQVFTIKTARCMECKEHMVRKSILPGEYTGRKLCENCFKAFLLQKNGNKIMVVTKIMKGFGKTRIPLAVKADKENIPLSNMILHEKMQKLIELEIKLTKIKLAAMKKTETVMSKIRQMHTLKEE